MATFIAAAAVIAAFLGAVVKIISDKKRGRSCSGCSSCSSCVKCEEKKQDMDPVRKML